MSRPLGACWIVAVALCIGCAEARADEPATRERQRLDTGWRFHRGDPPDIGSALDYDRPPRDAASREGMPADARPMQPPRAAGDDRGTLRPWILPTANRFISDPARRHPAPHAEPAVQPAFARPEYDDSAWERVEVPHDWAIAGPFIADGPHGGMGRLPSWGVGWYRREVDLPESAHGRRVLLDVDGAMSYASVWVNGRLAGGWPYGYNGWRLDLTPLLNPGHRNVLAIRLDNPPASARWYPGGGLYRDVWLSEVDPVHVAHWGTRITTPKVTRDAATVEVEVRIANAGRRAALVVARTELFALGHDDRARGRALARIESVAVTVAPGGERTVVGRANIAHPRLWGPPPEQRPHRHVAITTLSIDGRTVDRVRSRFGIREVRFDPRRGVLVNGEPVALRGVNNHHDLGALGVAFNRRAAERQLELLRELGANALRTAHNPPSSELLDLADRMGFLVVDEIFDAWEAAKTPFDFHRVFADWHEPDLRAMLRRDRNHPSVVMWSIGNEVGEQYTAEEGAEIARRLVAIVREEDPTRPTTTAMNWAKPDMPLPRAVDVIGLNYQGEGIRQDPEFEGTERIRTPPMYAAFRSAFPDKMVFSSETASTLSTRGTYLFPVSAQRSAPVRDGRGGDPVRRHVSAYDLYAVDFGSSPDKVFAALDAHPEVAGEFVWTGFDYLGEPTPYEASRSSYSGIIDLAGFPKDRYYLYQSRWRPTLRLAHLLPHWTWPGREGEVTPVHVFTTGDEAELFVNDISQGRVRKEPGTYRMRWDHVVYRPGTLRVQTWRNGAPWASATARTAGPPARLSLTVDRSTIRADGRDLAFVTVRVLDAQGRFVPTAASAIRFELVGPGRIVATDNGDPTDLTSFLATERAAFSGLALVVVGGRRDAAGTLRLTARAEGMATATASIRTRSDVAHDRSREQRP